ncbi:MAG: DUF1801 domain-containing protein [Polyangiaceae bacterium]
MAELKTKKNDASVDGFLAKIKNETQQRDARAVLAMMQRITGEKPKMWGSSIVGFGEYHYRYASGREADWPMIGFSPRAQNLTLYLMAGFDRLGDKLKKLGQHSTAKSCLYVKRLADVDTKILESIVAQGFKETRALNKPSTAAKRATVAKKSIAPARKSAARKSAAKRKTSR